MFQKELHFHFPKLQGAINSDIRLLVFLSIPMLGFLLGYYSFNVPKLS